MQTNYVAACPVGEGVAMGTGIIGGGRNNNNNNLENAATAVVNVVSGTGGFDASRLLRNEEAKAFWNLHFGPQVS